MSDFKMIIVMRKDLNMRKGKLVAQGAHAAVGLTLENLDHVEVKAWLASSFKKICVYVESEQELLDVVAEATRNGLLTKKIIDAGHTEFHGVPTLTCAAIGPAGDAQLKPVTGHLKLM